MASNQTADDSNSGIELNQPSADAESYETPWGDVVYATQHPDETEDTILASYVEQHSEKDVYGVFLGEMYSLDDYDVTNHLSTHDTRDEAVQAAKEAVQPQSGHDGFTQSNDGGA